MPPFLAINGVTIPVADGGWSLSSEIIGDSGRAFNGQYLSTRRALKRRWSITTTPLTRERAEALQAILQGQGDVWSFDTNLYSSKGYPFDTGTINTSVEKYGLGCLQLTGAGSTVTASSHLIPHAGARAYTLASWLRGNLSTGSLKARVLELDGDESVLTTQNPLTVSNDNTWHYVAGSWVAHADTAYLRVQVLVDDTPSGSGYVDDLLVVPAKLPSAYLQAMRDTGLPMPAAPRLRLTGDLVGQERVTCEAQLSAGEGVQFAGSDGAWHNTGQVLEFDLIEV